MMAVAITFSAMAQTTDKKGDKQKEFRKGQRHQGAKNYEKLNLTDQQKAQMKSVNENFKKQMQDLRSQGSITVDQQKEKRTELAKQHREQLAAILTPEQKQQAKEFKAHYKDGVKGDRKGKMKDFTKVLNLSSDQSSKIASLNETFKSNIKNIKQNSSLNDEQKKDQMKSLMKDHRSAVNNVLTPEQKKQMKDRLKNRPNRNAVK